MTTKQPDWTQAPEWAQWWAIDENGQAWWYKLKPVIKKGVTGRGDLWGVENPYDEEMESLHNDATNWQQSLTQRPK